MQLGYFTERPYRWVNEDELYDNQAFFALPNAHFDHGAGRRRLQLVPRRVLLRRGARLRRARPQRAPRQPVLHGQRDERRGGDPRPHHQAGADRADRQPAAGHQAPPAHGGGAGHDRPASPGAAWSPAGCGARAREQFFNNANPAYNREMFEEAHDFIVAGVDPARPVALRGQALPLPPREPVGAALPEAAPADVDPRRALPRDRSSGARQHRYPYIGLGTALGPTCDLWDMYADSAAEHGYQAGPENFGYLAAVRGRHRGEGPGAGHGLRLRRRAERLLPARAHAAPRLQLQGRQPAAGQDAAGRHLARRQPREADGPDHRAPTPRPRRAPG